MLASAQSFRSWCKLTGAEVRQWRLSAHACYYEGLIWLLSAAVTHCGEEEQDVREVALRAEGQEQNDPVQGNRQALVRASRMLFSRFNPSYGWILQVQKANTKTLLSTSQSCGDCKSQLTELLTPQSTVVMPKSSYFLTIYDYFLAIFGISWLPMAIFWLLYG